MGRKSRLEKEFASVTASDVAVEVAFTLLAKSRCQTSINQIVALVGFERAVLLMLVLGGKKLYIPKLDRFPQKLKIAKAGLDAYSGLGTVSQVSSRYKIHRKKVEEAAKRIHAAVQMRKGALKEYHEVLDTADIKAMTTAFEA